MNKLTIFWGNKTEPNFRWELSAPLENAKAVPEIESHELLKADLACLAEMAAHCQVELVVSSNDVQSSLVSIPGKAQRHLRKAVPYLLEEQVAESVDDIFIAIGNRNQDEKIPVRIIAHFYLQQLIAQFRAAEIKLHKISVDIDHLAPLTDGVRVLIKDEEVLVVEPHHRWRCDSSQFSWLMQKQLQVRDENDEMPVAIPMEIVATNEDDVMLFEQQLPAGRFAPQSMIIDNVEQYLRDSGVSTINLLQGEFEPKKENSALQQSLKKVAMISSFVLMGYVIFQGSLWFSLQAQATRLDNEKEAIWKQAFPGRAMPKTANSQMSAALKTIEGKGPDSAFLQLLDQVTEKISDYSVLYPTNISFDDARNELRLDLIGKEYATLNAYRDELIGAGFQVEMNSATQRGDGYSSRFIVRK